MGHETRSAGWHDYDREELEVEIQDANQALQDKLDEIESKLDEIREAQEGNE
jgi:hypothetical protein